MIDDVRAIRDGFEARRHEFRQANGEWRRCGGPRYCRECNREAAARKARKAARAQA